MYRLMLIMLLLPFAAAAEKDKGSDYEACEKGRVEVAKKASEFNGNERIKRLINADIVRAGKEQAEGDPDECLEALDHATKLINGQY